MDRKFLTIAIAVAAVHFVWLASGAFYPDLLKNTPPSHKLIVKTIALKPMPQTRPVSAPIAAKAEIKKEVIAKEKAVVAPVKKKEAEVPLKKNVPEPKREVVKKPAIEEKKDPVKEKLLAAAKENLRQALATQKTTLAPLKEIEPVIIEGEDLVGEEEIGYFGMLAASLQQALRLPDTGDVKISLILERNGKVQQVKVLHSLNINNSRYVEKVLPQVQFPSFGTFFDQEQKHTFTITLTHDT